MRYDFNAIKKDPTFKVLSDNIQLTFNANDVGYGRAYTAILQNYNDRSTVNALLNAVLSPANLSYADVFVVAITPEYVSLVQRLIEEIRAVTNNIYPIRLIQIAGHEFLNIPTELCNDFVSLHMQRIHYQGKNWSFQSTQFGGRLNPNDALVEDNFIHGKIDDWLSKHRPALAVALYDVANYDVNAVVPKAKAKAKRT